MDMSLQPILNAGKSTAPTNYKNKAQGPLLPTPTPMLPSSSVYPTPATSSLSPHTPNQNPRYDQQNRNSRQYSSHGDTPGYNNGGVQAQGLSNVPHNMYCNCRAPPLPQTKPNGGRSNANCEVEVSGFPWYTQRQDIKHVFSRWGSVVDVRMYQRRAVVGFAAPEQATAAVRAHRKVSVYGEFLSVVMFKAGEDLNWFVQHECKREFPRSKEKGTVLDPKVVDLSGNFDEQLDKLLAAIRLTKEEVDGLGTLYDDVQDALQEAFPGCVSLPFGSVVCGLGIKSSDADCFVDIPPDYRSNQVAVISRAKRELSRLPHLFSEILSIPRANTPIIKFFHIPTKTNCDVSFKTLLGVRNSRLVYSLLRVDPRLVPLCVVIKYWAKVHGLSGTGKLSNYALTMLVVFYLQQPTLKILPSINWLQRDPANDFIVDFWNTGFSTDMPPVTCEASIAKLLGGFFEFYSTFNFKELMICPYLGYPVKREIFKDINQLPNGFERYKDNVTSNNTFPIRLSSPICIQDPFEQGHNVGSSISSSLAMEIDAFFKFAADAYHNDDANHSKEFLKVILLQKPKLTINSPEYKIHLAPSFITANIMSPDWKSVVREVVFTIFEKMLKLRLNIKEETVAPNGKKLKEMYTGTVTKHIWDRKQFNREYKNSNLIPEERESEITRQIMKTYTITIKLDFQLMITYVNYPKRVMCNINLIDGKINEYREFGKFFISVTQAWLLNLLRFQPNNFVRNMPSKKPQKLKVYNKRKVKNNKNSESNSIDNSKINHAVVSDNITNNVVVNNDVVHQDVKHDLGSIDSNVYAAAVAEHLAILGLSDTNSESDREKH